MLCYLFCRINYKNDLIFQLINQFNRYHLILNTEKLNNSMLRRQLININITANINKNYYYYPLSPQNRINFNFVKQKQLDEIALKYGQSKWEKIKMYGGMFAHIGMEGFKEFKSDFKRYFYQLKDKETLTDQETHQVMRINQDIGKIGPLIIIQILPFSGPLFMLYMYIYPGSIPSWFLIDYYHDKHELLKVTNQKKALLFFQEMKWTSNNINLDSISLRQLRKLSLLIFGYYRDGTIGYRKMFNKKIQYFICESFSKYLIRRQIKKRIDSDLFHNQITNQMQTLQERIRWKFEKVMNGEHHIEYKPLYDKAQQRSAADGMSFQAKIFQQISADKGKIQNTNQKPGTNNNQKLNTNSSQKQKQEIKINQKQSTNIGSQNLKVINNNQKNKKKK